MSAQSILDLFASACRKFPDGCAIDIPPSHDRVRVAVSYCELDRIAWVIADLLAARIARDQGDAPRQSEQGDGVVAICLPRTDVYLYASILGAMRAGFAYCAIDPSFPTQQAAEIIRDAHACAVIGEVVRIQAVQCAEQQGVALTPADIDAAACASGAVSAVRNQEISGESLAYVIYTSGTTGKPKGVEVSHAAIFNLIESDRHEFSLCNTDRVAQGSSASYDSSIEEMWLAWAVGATVVVMDDQAVRLGPDLVEWLAAERVSALCPAPTLLRTLGCRNPSSELPELRFIYVGGEALPQDVADSWSVGRRLENGYGPTECAVTCLRSRVQPGCPVTIGRPIPHTQAWVVDPDDPALTVRADDVRGELVIGGASLARGYRGQPEVTAQRFVWHQELGRIYRTGDLVHRDSVGDFHYHGRIDAQVKLRGYRIELGAIEARLAAHESVLEAACTVEGSGSQQTLVAHVVRRDGLTMGVESVHARESLRKFVALTLAPYMVPSTVNFIDSVPRTVGGKIDRKRLPVIGRVLCAAEFQAPETGTERLVIAALTQVLGCGDRPKSISVTADFFQDLGMDSLTLAMTVSALRLHPQLQSATVRLTYEHRNARAVAAVLDSFIDKEPRRTDIESVARGVSRPIVFSSLQCVFLLVALCVGAQLLWIPLAFAEDLMVSDPGWLSALRFLAYAMVMLTAYTVLTTFLAVGAKWILVGRYQPMRVRAWSMWHLRHWMTVRLASLAPWSLLEALSLAPILLRLLGARVGRNVHIGRGVRFGAGGWDLLQLEDGATIGQDASLRMVELRAGCLWMDSVTVGRGATIETRAGVSPGGHLGAGSILRALSSLQHGAVVSNSVLDGVPANTVGVAPAVPLVPPAQWPVVRVVEASGLLAVMLGCVALPWYVAMMCTDLGVTQNSVAPLFMSETSALLSASAVGKISFAVVIAGMSSVLLQALFARLIGSSRQETVSLGSFASLRQSIQSMLVESSGKWLSGTLMWPRWLRLAGATIGADCEISTVTGVVPSSVVIGTGTFFADGIYLGGQSLHAGTSRVSTIKLGSGCFVGNHAVLPSGTTLEDGTLVGISTRADHLPAITGASWFGHPAFQLPRREVVEAPRTHTHTPTFLRWLNRWIWELARFALPVPLVLGALCGWRWFEINRADGSPVFERLVWLPAMLLAAIIILSASILALKWLLLGRVKPGVHPLWSCWCSRWDFLFVAWGMWAAPALSMLEGTVFLVWYLRLMGCRIGKRALLGGGFSHVVDPDMLNFGDDVTVQALFQAHTFEDRVLKIDHVYVEDGATVGAQTVLLYGARIGARAIVEPHSVVMKRESLSANSVYEGVPVVLVSQRT